MVMSKAAQKKKQLLREGEMIESLLASVDSKIKKGKEKEAEATTTPTLEQIAVLRGQVEWLTQELEKKEDKKA